MKLTKQEIRNSALSIRNNLKIDDKYHLDHLIYKLTIDYFKKLAGTKNILAYWPTENEVDSIAIIDELLKMGHNVFLPHISKKNSIEAIKITNLSFEYEYWKSIKQPLKPIKKNKDKKIDIVLAPLIAFDNLLHRIGYGVGCYDRFLSKLNYDVLKIGLAYNFQLYNEIPSEKHDISMNIIITNEKILEKGK